MGINIGNKITEGGIIVEKLPGAMFRVELIDGRSVIGYLAGKMRLNRINVNLGDQVRIELDPYGGKTTNRIVRRL